MIFRRVLLCALCLGLLSVARAESRTVAHAPPVAFSAPEKFLAAGPLGANDYQAVLPSGRIVKPEGASVVVGMNPLGVALSVDGRFAIVTNDDEREGSVMSALVPSVGGGYSLSVVDTSTMRVVDHYRSPGAKFFLGVLATQDPRDPSTTLVLASGGPSNVVYVFTLDAAGHLTLDAVPSIAMPVPYDARFADAQHAYPGTIIAAGDGLHAYVVNELGANITTIDLSTRKVSGSSPAVGYFPYGAARAGSRLLVTNEGLMRYAVLGAPSDTPAFTSVRADPEHASSLSVLPIAPGGKLGSAVNLALDHAPDGLAIVGGAHPTAIAVTPDNAFAFVTMTNVDRIATISLKGTPHAVGGTELRLFDRAPYGTQPNALALSKDGQRLYVALAGLDAIAVLDARDPVHLHRLGLIPTGWYPSAIALSADDRTLYVVNAKGFGHERGFRGGLPRVRDSAGHVLQVGADSNTIWGTLQRVDLTRLNLKVQTRDALAFTRATKPAVFNPVLPQVPSAGRSKVIDHVVMILQENKTYDSMLGDLTDANGRPYGPGDPNLVAFGESVTPNLHELARTFGLTGNFFADAEESDAGHQFAAGGITTVYSEKTLLAKGGRAPLVNKNEDPEDYPRAGYIFNNLARHRMTFRDYGDFMRVAGYDEGRAPDPKTDDPAFVNMADRQAPTKGLGGKYSLDVPALGILGGHTDLNYPGWNLRIRDERRAREFIRDYGALVSAGKTPQFTYIWLPDDHGGAGKDIPPLPEEVADGDRALGMIVEYLTHLPTWRSTAIFITPDDAQSTRDHVNEHRSYAIVVSPYARRRHVGMVHLSTVSVLKTEEELLGLPALSLGDLLATDMSDFFTTRPNLEPFRARPVATQTASAAGARIAALLERTDQSQPDADVVRSARLIDLSRRADKLALRRGATAPGTYREAQRELLAAAQRLVQNR